MKLKYVVPNAISAFRLLCAYAVIYFVIEGTFTSAFSIIILGYLSDLIDGPIARRLRATSVWGKKFDLLADVVFDWGIIAGMEMTSGIETWLAIGIAAMAFIIRLPGFIPKAYVFGTVCLPFWAAGMAWVVYLYADLAGFGRQLLLAAVPIIAVVVYFKRDRIKHDLYMAMHKFLFS